MKNKSEKCGIMEYVGDFHIYIYKDMKSGDLSFIIFKDMVEV